MKNLNKAKVHIEFNPPQISINNSQSIIDEMIFDLSGISKPENNDFTDLNNGYTFFFLFYILILYY